MKAGPRLLQAPKSWRQRSFTCHEGDDRLNERVVKALRPIYEEYLDKFASDGIGSFMRMEVVRTAVKQE